jgi:hypothetical protein
MTEETKPNESRPFTCHLDDGTPEGITVEGLAIQSLEGTKVVYDVQVFLKTQFYTFCIIEQSDKSWLTRLVRVHDRTGTFVSLKTLLLTNTKVEQLFEQVLTSLLTKT